MNYLGAIVCYFKGHKRGKAVNVVDSFSIVRIFACPRCGRQTRYKVKEPTRVATSPSDGSPHFQETT